MAKLANVPCPRCGSKNVEAVNAKTQIWSAIGTIVIGLLLSLAWPPLVYVVGVAGIYLIVSALVQKPFYNCLDCRHRWPQAGAAAGDTGNSGSDSPE